MKTIALIVDNPLRDLDGMSFLAAKMASEGHECFLVSMYQHHEVYLIRPDFVVLNYIRQANLPFVKRCRELGIPLVVLDTEGGVLQNLDNYFSDIAPLTEFVDLYALWGEKQKQSLAKFETVDANKLVVTGHPRFDLYHPKYRHLLGSTGFSDKKMILVNTNFALSYPRFQTREQEVRDLIEIWKKPFELVEKWVAQQELALKAVVETVQYLAGRFPDIQIVVRPHPFEQEAHYKEFFADLPNVHIRQEGTVLPWIRDSLFLIHHNCSTAVEAAMMNKTAIHLNWAPTPDLAQPITQQASVLAESVEEVAQWVEQSQENVNQTSESSNTDHSEIFRDYFCGVDGQSTDRFYLAVKPLLDKNESRPSEGAYHLLWNALTGGRLKEFLKLSMIFGLGYQRFRALVDFVKRKKATGAKNFNLESVQPILSGFDQERHQGDLGIQCERPKASVSSVRVFPKFKPQRTL